MAGQAKPVRMPDFAYRVYMWFCRVTDLVHTARRRFQEIPVKEGMTVVDYGCRPGRYAVPAAEAVGPEGKVFAVDVHPLAVEATEKKARRESLTNLETVLVDGYDTGIESSSADLVMLLDALHMVGDRDAVLREVHRILKKDGVLFMDPGHMKLETAKEIVEGTGLFAVTVCRGRDMIVAPKVDE